MCNITYSNITSFVYKVNVILRVFEIVHGHFSQSSFHTLTSQASGMSDEDNILTGCLQCCAWAFAQRGIRPCPPCSIRVPSRATKGLGMEEDGLSQGQSPVK
jgi:hypothetical protein